MHGKRKHLMRGVCKVKRAAWTTWDAAMSAVSRTPGAIRAYRGDCCGYYHITRYTIDEFAQRMAELGCTSEDECDIVDPDDETGLEVHDGEEPEEVDRLLRRPERGADLGPDARGPGATPVERRTSPRLAPSPATLARRIQAGGDP